MDFSSMVAVASSLQISNTAQLANFNGFGSLQTIGGNFVITNDGGIHDFAGLAFALTDIARRNCRA